MAETNPLDIFNQKPEKPAVAALRRELERRSQDSIRVFNPTQNEKVVRWDGRGFVVPPKDRNDGEGEGQAILPRYLAQKYVREMLATIRFDLVREAVEAENARRVDKGMAQMTIHDGGEEVRFSERLLSTKYPNFQERYMRVLWVGVERQFGLDQPQDNRVDTPSKEPSLEERMDSLERLEAPANPEDVPEAPAGSYSPDLKADQKDQEAVREALDAGDEAQGLQGKKQFELQKIARERGIEYAKTDRKQALIDKISAGGE